MNPAIFQSPSVQTALPIMFSIVIAVWIDNKAFDTINRPFDDVKRRLDDIIRRLERIEIKQDDHEQRIKRLDIENSPLVKR